LSQILAWLAKERRDIQEQLGWREQIPELMAPLLNRKRGAKERRNVQAQLELGEEIPEFDGSATESKA
jgi:hypothetical protein